MRKFIMWYVSISLVLSAGLTWMGFRHNSQGEFQDGGDINILYLFELFISWFVFFCVFFSFAMFVIVAIKSKISK